jgi:hypothetical protein
LYIHAKCGCRFQTTYINIKKSTKFINIRSFK